VVIARYTRPELGRIWTDDARMEFWRQVEVAACEAMEGPTAEDLEAIRAATFTVDAVNEREKVTDHDLAAFVDVLSASAGDAGRWIHFGLTSSDVLDTALALQLRAAGEPIVAGARELVVALANRAREFEGTLCVGRTHGIQAEPTTFGIKLAGFAFEAHRNAERLERAFAQAAVGGISGAVGTYAATSPDFERRVMERLGLRAEDVSTQVVPRDRHAELLQAVALAGAGLERFATEIRHLQRTEVREVEEPFRAGQKGSSAMPHKRNPIVSERICGIARLLRGYSQVDRMLQNLEATHGALYSQRALLALVESGMSRDDAYRIVQENAQRAWDTGTPFRELLAEAVPQLNLDAIFDPAAFVRHAGEIVGRLDAIVPQGAAKTLAPA
jgi:adenylosuccinate lyase